MREYHQNEEGFALIMTVFIVALATLLVLDFSAETLSYQRLSRAHTERVQAHYVIKSTVNVARLLLELPKLPVEGPEGIRISQEDWLGEPWALVAGIPALPFPGEPRLSIVDEGGKLNINALGRDISGAAGSAPTGTDNPNEVSRELFWSNALSLLFENAGFVDEGFEEEKNRTPGDRAYSPDNQVAIIHDWLDRDSNSFGLAGFPGSGIESGGEREFFFNRELKSLSELLMVPGFTRERLQRIAPYIQASPTRTTRININTAPVPVLVALGMAEFDAVKLSQERLSTPITDRMRREEIGVVYPDLIARTSQQSSLYSAYIKVKLSNSTRIAKAVITASGSTRRRTTLNSIAIN